MFDNLPAKSPEKALWIEVLLLAVQDALHGVPGGLGRGKEARIRLTEETRLYLTTASKDLSAVCDLAGLDPAAVMDQMRKQIAATPTPEELIERPRTTRNDLSYGPPPKSASMRGINEPVKRPYAEFSQSDTSIAF